MSIDQASAEPQVFANAVVHRRFLLTSDLWFAALAMASGRASSAPAEGGAPMPHRKLGSLDVSALGLGCMTMNSGNDNALRRLEDMLPVFHYALDAGITLFYTAEAYGPSSTTNWSGPPCAQSATAW